MTAALLAVVALASVTPGTWTGSTAERADGTRARVTFEVVPEAGVVSPFVRVDLRGCRSTRTVHLRRSFGLVRARGGRVVTRARYSPPGRGQVVRLRFTGRFRGETVARGSVRGRIRFVGGHICRIPRLAWVARPAGVSDPIEVADPDDLDDVVVDENLEDGDYEEDDFEDDTGDGDDPGDDEDEGDDEP